MNKIRKKILNIEKKIQLNTSRDVRKKSIQLEDIKKNLMNYTVNINDTFDNIFILTIKRSNRIKKMENRLKASNITNYEIFYGFDTMASNLPYVKKIKSSSKHEIINYIKLFNEHLEKKGIIKITNNNYFKPGQIGTSISFYNILKKSIEENYDKILIFEDDVYFKNFNEMFSNFYKSVPKDYDLIYLDINHLSFKKGGWEKVKLNKHTCVLKQNYKKIKDNFVGIGGTYAFVLNKKLIKILYDNFFPIKYPFDIYLYHITKANKYNVYIPCNKFVYVNIAVSYTITDKYEPKVFNKKTKLI